MWIDLTQRRPGLCCPLAFLRLNSPQIDWCWQWLRVLCRKDGARRRRVFVCEQGRQHNTGAPNTRGSTQWSHRAPKALPKALPGCWDTVTAWAGLARLERLASGTGGQLRCHLWVRRPLLHLRERTWAQHTHTQILSLPPLLHPPEQLLMFHSSKLDLVTEPNRFCTLATAAPGWWGGDVPGGYNGCRLSACTTTVMETFIHASIQSMH